MQIEPKKYPPVPYQRHVFVCCFGKTCPNRSGAEIAGLLKQKAKAAGITDRIRVNRSGCLNQCATGPSIVVYPENIWYAGVRAEDVDEIFERTVLEGEAISRLVSEGGRES